MLEQHWHKGYLIYGAENYLIKQLIDQIEDAFIAPGMQAIDRIQIKVDNFISTEQINRLKQELQTPAFLSQRKVIIVRNSHVFGKAEKGSAAQHKEMISRLEEIFPLLNEAACLIFWEENIDKRRKGLLTDWQNSDGVIVEVGREELSVLRKWLQLKADQASLRIDTDAADSLIERCESDMEQIDKEFSKVALYAGYKKADRINSKMIALVCRPDLTGTVFNLTDAVAAGKPGEVLRILNILLALKEPIPLLRFMLVRHIKQLIVAKELNQEKAIIAQLGVYPFVAKRLIQQARHMRIEQLEDLYRRAFLSEWRVKSGRMDEQLAFETLLIEAALAFAKTG